MMPSILLFLAFLLIIIWSKKLNIIVKFITIFLLDTGDHLSTQLNINQQGMMISNIFIISSDQQIIIL